MSERPGTSEGSDVPVDQLSYTDASNELDRIVQFFEQRDVDVDQIVSRLERATAIVDELDRRIRRTRAQVEQLVPRLEAVSRRDEIDASGDGPGSAERDEGFDDASPASSDAERSGDFEDGSQLF